MPPDYATTILMNERKKIQLELQKLDVEFTKPLDFESWEKGERWMPVEDYETKAMELYEKRDSIDHALTMLSIKSGG